MNKIADVMTAFSSAARIEGVHPLQCGIVRRKVRTTRRHGMPIVNPLIFYPVRAVEFVSVVAQWLTVGWRYHRIKKRIVQDPASKTYVDDATRPALIEDAETDELVVAFADKIPDTYGAPKRQPRHCFVSVRADARRRTKPSRPRYTAAANVWLILTGWA